MIQPSSVDVRLDRFFRVFENHRYPAHRPGRGPARADPAGRARRTTSRSSCTPGEFVLGSTYEVITLPDDVAARLEGKSSLGRLGLLTHSTAGFIDPGFSGHVTLELSNVATLPIKLWPGMKIGQLCFFRLSLAGRAPLRQREVRLALPGPARPDAVPVVPELPPHQDLTPRHALTPRIAGGRLVRARRTRPSSRISGEGYRRQEPGRSLDGNGPAVGGSGSRG